MARVVYFWLISVALVAVAIIFVRPAPKPAPTVVAPAPKIAQRNVPRPKLMLIDGAAGKREAELSGLAWYGQELILLPQYLASDSEASGHLFAISEAQLDKALSMDRPGRIAPRRIEIEITWTMSVDGFEGFEAIAFFGNRVYLLAEADKNNQAFSYLFVGDVIGAMEKIVVDTSNAILLEPPKQHENLAFEALVVTGDGVLALPEVHGEVKDVFAWQLDHELQNAKKIPLQALDFRLTDVTAADSQRGFWGVNVHWPGGKRMPSGKRQPRFAVERIIRFAWNENGIEQKPERTVPIRIRKRDKKSTINWEGIANFRGGFLLVSDEHPQTLLAWVPATPGR